MITITTTVNELATGSLEFTVTINPQKPGTYTQREEDFAKILASAIAGAPTFRLNSHD